MRALLIIVVAHSDHIQIEREIILYSGCQRTKISNWIFIANKNYLLKEEMTKYSKWRNNYTNKNS